MRNLRILNLENNELTQLWFLDQLRRIESINFSGNSVSTLFINHSMPYLKILRMAQSGLDSIWITRDLPILEEVDLGHNKILHVDRLIYHAPQIRKLNIEHNRLGALWPAGLQFLEYLDVSNNQIEVINPIVHNPALSHLNLQGNRIGDIQPVLAGGLSKQLNYLNILDNPVSKESYIEFFPICREHISVFLEPNEFEPLMSCYPSPFREAFLKDEQVTVSWQLGSDQSENRYTLLFGKEQTLDTVAIDLHEPKYRLDVQANERYYWRVITDQGDTTFTSGLFSFQTFRPVVLPYRESFEHYTTFDYLGEEAPHWRTHLNKPGSEFDAQIVNFKSLEGSQSLRMISHSKLGLMVNQFKGSRLMIRFGLYFEENSRGAVKVVQLNGADLVIYFKSNGKGDIFYNDKQVGEFFYNDLQWMDWYIFINGSVKAMDVRMNGRLLANEKLAFPNLEISFEKLEFSTDAGPKWPHDGFPLFYLDDLYVSGHGQMTGVSSFSLPDVQMYPNPVDETLYVQIDPVNPLAQAEVFTSHGSQLKQMFASKSRTTVQIPLEDLPPGIYLIKLSFSNGESRVERIVVN